MLTHGDTTDKFIVQLRIFNNIKTLMTRTYNNSLERFTVNWGLQLFFLFWDFGISHQAARTRTFCMARPITSDSGVVGPSIFFWCPLSQHFSGVASPRIFLVLLVPAFFRCCWSHNYSGVVGPSIFLLLLVPALFRCCWSQHFSGVVGPSIFLVMLVPAYFWWYWSQHFSGVVGFSIFLVLLVSAFF